MQSKQKKIEMKKKKREAKKKELLKIGDQKLQKMNAPNFGFKEGELIGMKTTLNQLAVSNNNIAQEIDNYRKIDIVTKTLESHWMSKVLLKQVENCGVLIAVLSEALDKLNALDDASKEKISSLLPTHERLLEASKKAQEKDLGLKDKPEQVVAMGDIIVMGYQLHDLEDKLIEDRLKHEIAYEVGGKALDIDEGVVGMVPGETRFFQLKIKGGMIPKEYAGKELKMQVLCKGVRVREKK